MEISRYNFENPRELLEELKFQRCELRFQTLVEQCNFEFIQKKDEIERNKLLKNLLDVEFKLISTLRANGSLDRIGYREALEKFQPELLAFDRKISKLKMECNLIEGQVENYEKYLRTAKDFLQIFDLNVVSYSVVTLFLNRETFRYLLVPDAIRQVYFDLNIELLATNSALGSVLMYKEVGKVSTFDKRFRELFIEKIEVASDEILEILSGVFYKTQFSPAIRMMNKETTDGSLQRWRDGARSDSYIVCYRCESLYIMGSICKC